MVDSMIQSHFAVVYSNEQKYFNSRLARVDCFQDICKNSSLYKLFLRRSRRTDFSKNPVCFIFLSDLYCSHQSKNCEVFSTVALIQGFQ